MLVTSTEKPFCRDSLIKGNGFDCLKTSTSANFITSIPHSILHLNGFQGSNSCEKVLITTQQQFSGKSFMFRILIFGQKILFEKYFKTVKLVKKCFLIFHQLRNFGAKEKNGERIFSRQFSSLEYLTQIFH